MWKAAEALDDVVMPPGEVEIGFKYFPLAGRHAVTEPGVQRDAIFLVSQCFRMFQRQVEEHAFDGQQRLIHAFIQARLAPGLRERVTRKRSRRIAMDRPGKLVNDNDQRQSPVGSGFPCAELSFNGLLVQPGKTFADQCIILLSTPPELGLPLGQLCCILPPAPKPEVEHFGGGVSVGK